MGKWLRAGALLGPLAVAVVMAGRRERGSSPPPLTPYHAAQRKLLILGAGFGGFYVAHHLAGRLAPDIAVLVLDRHDFLTFLRSGYAGRRSCCDERR